VHFAQFFRDQRKKKEEFIDEYHKHESKYQLSNIPEFDAVFEFYKKIFTFSESSAYEKVGDKIGISLNELQLYLDESSNTAVVNKSYSYLIDVVEKVANSEWFSQRLGDVNIQALASKISAIGSELKPTKQADHGSHHAPHSQKADSHQHPVQHFQELTQPKAPEPEKHLPVSPTKTQPHHAEVVEHREEVKSSPVKQEPIKPQVHPVHQVHKHEENKGENEEEGDDEDDEEDDQGKPTGGERKPKQEPGPDEGFITVGRKKKTKPEEDSSYKKPYGGPRKYGKPPQAGQGKPYEGKPYVKKPRPEGEQGPRPQGGPQGGPPGERGDRPQTFQGPRRGGNTGPYEKRYEPRSNKTDEKPAQ